MVSVIIPVYNVERYLARCLDSVIAQTYRDIEIICVNDGSTDGSAAILDDYARRDSRIRIVTQPNGGLSAARNSGLEIFRGDWVVFVDSDDWIPPYAIETFLKAGEESGAPVVVSEQYAVDDAPQKRAIFRWELHRPALAKLVGHRKMQSSAWNKFYRADMVRNRRFIPGIYFEDWPFVTELFGDIDSFALVREPLYVYCTNDDAASIVRSPFNQKKADGYVAGIRHVMTYFAGHPQRKWAMRRVMTAAKMLRKRARRASLHVPHDIPYPLLCRAFDLFHHFSI